MKKLLKITKINQKSIRLNLFRPPFLLILGALGLLLSVVLPEPAFANGLEKFSFPVFSSAENQEGGQDYSVTLQILLLMTSLTFIPAAVLSMTSFTRIIIVFSILRQALGLQQTPSNQILLGMALFITIFVMTPVFERVNAQAVQPYLNDQLTTVEAFEKASEPFRAFMMAQTREDDLQLFLSMSGKTGIADRSQIPFTVLIPSFIVSELKTAFQIGFLLFIPFLIIDLVVASVLMAMGMMMLSPLIVSLPFKIMLFVFVDGWALVIGSLATSFRGI